jgi:hypothetical protein
MTGVNTANLAVIVSIAAVILAVLLTSSIL